MSDNNGWAEYKQLVLRQLEGLTDKIDKLETKIDSIKEDIIILKVKAWAFGIIGGAVVTLIIQIILNWKVK